MLSIFPFLITYCSNKRGATAIEYALIAAGISVALIASIYLFGDGLEALYTETLPGALENE